MAGHHPRRECHVSRFPPLCGVAPAGRPVTVAGLLEVSETLRGTNSDTPLAVCRTARVDCGPARHTSVEARGARSGRAMGFVRHIAGAVGHAKARAAFWLLAAGRLGTNLASGHGAL